MDRKRKRTDIDSASTPCKRSRRERKPSARFLERDTVNRSAFTKGGRRKSQKAGRSEVERGADDPIVSVNYSASPPTRKNASADVRSGPHTVECIEISDDSEDETPAARRTHSHHPVECIEIGDSDIEISSATPSTMFSAPMTPEGMSNSDRQHFKEHPGPQPIQAPSPHTERPVRPSHANKPPSSSLSSSHRNLTRRASQESNEDRPSKFLCDVQSLLADRRTRRSFGQAGKLATYHDFGPNNKHPPALFQAFVDGLADKSGS